MRILSSVRRMSLSSGFGMLSCAALICCSLSSCTSVSRAQFQCDPDINNGLLLAIDLIEVHDEEVRMIQQAGEDWFTSDTRKALQDRIKTISVRGSCSEIVELQGLTTTEKFLRKKKGYGKLAIIAEYETISGEHAAPSVKILPRKAWKGKKILIRVHQDYLTVEGAL